ncbi:MAG: hypothetical protein J2P36_32120, partial [Ktedonobacteraceae bacterium]|nr:hypothetical protein [Ktedonobacteraceae bacterium]
KEWDMDERDSLCSASAFSMPYSMKEGFVMENHAASVNKQTSPRVILVAKSESYKTSGNSAMLEGNDEKEIEEGVPPCH